MSLTKIEEIDTLIGKVQSEERARRGLGLLLVLLLGCCLVYFVWQLWPRRYVFNSSGGEVLSNRNYLMRKLTEEASSLGVDLLIEPTSGSLETLDLLSRGQLDLAMVLGGLNVVHPGVQHVATVDIEPLQLLVRPDIKSLQDLRGRRVNTGPDREGAWSVARAVLEFAGLQNRVDYARTRYTEEELAGRPADELPEAIFVLSTVPGPLAEFLVHERGYQLLEIPFPPALALRHGWVADREVLAYSYQVQPPVPARNLHTVGVRTYLVGREGLPPQAVSKVLSALYSPNLQRLLHQQIDPNIILDAPVYPVSPGTQAYLHRDQSVFSFQTINAISQQFGAGLSMIGFILAVRRWLRGPAPRPHVDDDEFKGYLMRVAEQERRMGEALSLSGEERQLQLREVQAELSALTVKVLERYPQAQLGDAALLTGLLHALRNARVHCHAMLSSQS